MIFLKIVRYEPDTDMDIDMDIGIITALLHSKLQGQLYTLKLCNNWHISGVSLGGIPYLPCVIWPIIELLITCQLI